MSDAPVDHTSELDRARAREEVLRRLRARDGSGQDIPRVPRDRPVALSFAQQRLWSWTRCGRGAPTTTPPWS
ncbi:hypothetical protein HFP72_01210 [Nocardiopsis sp. ARC36]